LKYVISLTNNRSSDGHPIHSWRRRLFATLSRK